MRRRAILDIGLGVLVIGLGMLIAGQNSRFLAQMQPHKLTRPPIPKGPIVYPAIPVQQPQGAPAIHPAHRNGAAALTADEVRQFVTSAGALGGNGTQKASISRVDCSLTAGNVKSTLQGRNTGLPDEMPVCYVELAGTFTFYGPPSPRSQHGTILTFHTAFQVFDTKTGNVMLSGAFDHSP
jgi:hypothetical protein